MEQIVPGLVAEQTKVVMVDDTAEHLGSGTAPVLATPRLILLLESTAVAATQPFLPAGYQTVGVRVDIRHIAATPVGMRVRARAELVAREGRRLTFRVEAWDEHELIGEGTHERVLVETARFVARVKAKLQR
ncbi:MAG TPA: thioesterase family protein [Herpetosiphonaceae bacterium]|nr:thioesterase family protein [Herpetosiphonaceae bacterium]